MNRSLAFGALPIYVMLCGCESQQQVVDDMQPKAVQVAQQRGSFELGLLFRYLNYRFSSGSKNSDLTIGGPMVGATFRW